MRVARDAAIHITGLLQRRPEDDSGDAAGIVPELPLREVGSYPANAIGLYDMRGSVWEWCADWFDRSYYSRSPRDDPQGPAAGFLKVVRGGDWIFVGEVLPDQLSHHVPLANQSVCRLPRRLRSRKRRRSPIVTRRPGRFECSLKEGQRNLRRADMPRTPFEGAACGRIGLQVFRRLSVVQRLLLLQAALNVLLIPLWLRDRDAAPQRSKRVNEKTAKQFLTCRLPSTDNAASQDVRCYRLLAPSTIEAGKTYPLLVFLHGAGERGNDNVNQLTHLPAQMSLPRWRSQFPCFLLAPQCPANENWSSSVADYPDRLELVMAMICQMLQRHPIDRRRVYLTGLSMGGFGAWELAARYPDAFAAAVPICGGGNAGRASRLVHVPIWAVHGDGDQAVPVHCSRTMIDALESRRRESEVFGVGRRWT